MGTVLYGLYEPGRGELRYIGKTTMRLSQRLQGHLYRARRGRDGTDKGRWIERLLQAGRKPDIAEIRAVADGEDWAEAEREAIQEHREAGCRLLNQAPGGNGSHTLKTRAAITSEVIARFGVDSDAMIAEDLGVSRKAVTYHREKMGIAAGFNRSRNKPPPPQGGHNRITLDDSIVAMIGTMPDHKLAEIAGCSKPVIARYRRKMSIKPFAEQTGNDGKFSGIGKHPRWKTEMKRGQPPACSK